MVIRLSSGGEFMFLMLVLDGRRARLDNSFHQEYTIIKIKVVGVPPLSADKT